MDSGRVGKNKFDYQSSTGAMVIIMRGNFQQEVDLGRIILQIITDYRAITTTEIWYELGEDDRFDGKITRAEVTEVVSELEKQNIIVKGKDDKWKINSLGTQRLSRLRVSCDQA